MLTVQRLRTKHRIGHNEHMTTSGNHPVTAADDPARRKLYAELRNHAAEVAVEAAELIRSQRMELGKDLHTYTRTKTSAVDPVTRVDEASEEFIATRIAQRRPGDGMIGEEGSERVSSTGVVWIVDPIDGTVNFLYDIPQYAVSIAAAIDGTVVAGAVCNVDTGECARAALGAGAQLRIGNNPATEQTLRINRTATLATALVATGFSYSSARRAEQAAVVAELLPQVRDIRRMGSAALDLVALAQGRVDAYYERGLNPWDYAAGCLIAREAGASVMMPGLASTSADNALVAAAHEEIMAEFEEAIGTST